jgi:hypothetical protein
VIIELIVIIIVLVGMLAILGWNQRHLLTVEQANKRAEHIIRLMRAHQIGFRRAVQMFDKSLEG